MPELRRCPVGGSAGSGVSFLRMRRRNASLAVVWGSTAAS